MVEERSMINILVLWRGQQLNVEMNLDSTVEEFGLKLQKLTNVKPDTLQLIVPRSTNRSSKLLTPFSNEHSKLTLKEISILEGKPIRMMGVFADEIEEVSQNSVKPDLRIAGFEEEDKRLRQRMLGAPQTLTIPQGPYIFSEFRTLQIPGIELNPPASEALRRMHMLASDPGIVAIMNKHRWRVGMMTELAPVGYVGINPKCILGFNKNHGEEISLRLRTDDLKGFRKYESIKKTLLHELAHMVYSEHDASFFALDKQLNKEAASLDWTKAKSYSLSGLKFSNHDNEEFNVGTSHYAQKLGGKTLDSLVDARASAVAAAYRRSSNASTNSSGDVQVCGESKKSHDILNHEHPEATRYAIHEPDPDDGELGCEEKRNNDHKTSVEPDPDDCQENNDITEYQSIFERYPNDSQVKKTVHVETSMEIDRSCSYDQCDEPDPDDCQSDENKVECGKGSDHNPDDSQEGEFMKCETYSKINDGKLFLHKVILKNKNRLEPDPDDFEASKNILECGNMSEPDADESRSNTVILEYENMEEPDPDDSEASMDKLKSKPREKLILEKAFQEPDPDDCGTKMAIFKHGITFEPDPDDSKENKTMQAEPDPDDCGSKVAILKYGNTFEPDPDDSKENKTMQAEPDPDEVVEKLLSFPISENSDMKIDESDPDDVAERPSSSACKKMSEDSWPVSGLSSDDRELQRIQDSVSVICSRLQKSIEMLRTEATPTEATSVLATLSKIIRNVIEHPDELKFRRLRKGNPAFQRNVANYKAAMEVLEAVGFYEDVLYDGIGKSEAYLVLKRNDPALLWLAKSSLEICSTA